MKNGVSYPPCILHPLCAPAKWLCRSHQPFLKGPANPSPFATSLFCVCPLPFETQLLQSVILFFSELISITVTVTVRVKIITGSLVTPENLFPENYRYRYRLEIRMNFHYRYRLGPRSCPFISIDSQILS